MLSFESSYRAGLLLGRLKQNRKTEKNASAKVILYLNGMAENFPLIFFANPVKLLTLIFCFVEQITGVDGETDTLILCVEHEEQQDAEKKNVPERRASPNPLVYCMEKPFANVNVLLKYFIKRLNNNISVTWLQPIVQRLFICLTRI